MALTETSTQTDILLIGAGPIGLEMGVCLHRTGCDYIHIEAGQIGRTIANWPRWTRFLSAPEEVSIAGIRASAPGEDRLLAEQYLAYLRSVVTAFDLPVRTYQRVTDIRRQDDGRFLARIQASTGQESVLARRVVLATGDMAESRRLGVPGEHLPHVRHHYDALHDLFRQRVLIVGGRNSAMEAALRCQRLGAEVTVCTRERQVAWERVSKKIGPDVQYALDRGHLTLRPGLEVREIHPGRVVLVDSAGDSCQVEADFVLVLIGYRADVSLMEQLGVAFDPDGSVRLDETTMETTVAGVHVIGTAAAGQQQGHPHFIETCHVHVRRAAEALTGRPPGPTGAGPA